MVRRKIAHLEEEVKKFVYVGFLFRRNGSIDARVKKRVRKARIIKKLVWGIGERLFLDDFRRRLLVFDVLVANVMLYGLEM